MARPSWLDRLRLPGRGAPAPGLGLAVGFEGPLFRYLLTEAPPGGGARRVLRWGLVQREDRSEAQWLDRIKALGLGRVPATAMLAPHDYQVLQVDMPAVPDDELKAATRWRIKDMIHVPPEEVTIDLLRPPGHNAQMLVVVARNEVVRQTMLRCRAAGLALSAIDIPETGLRNLASAQVPPPGAVATLLEAGTECWFGLCADTELLALRRFPSDGEDGVSERTVAELRRTLDRLERQFPALRLGALLVDMGAWTPDYLTALSAATELPCQALGLSSALQLEGLGGADLQGDSAFLGLAGLSLREPHPA